MAKNHLLFVVRDRYGKLESVTVYAPWVKSESSPRPDVSKFGNLDIIYSCGSTYKHLDRPKSGFYTGRPLAREMFLHLTKRDAVTMAEIYYRSEFRPYFKKFGWWFPKRNKKGQFAK